MIVPSDLILSKFHPKISQFCLENKIPSGTDYDCLISFLLFEEIKNGSEEKLSLSILKNYFESLPKYFSEFPLNYSNDEIRLLKNTFFSKRLEKFKIEYEENFEKISEHFSRLNLNLDKEKFMKFYLILCSRSFGLDTEEGTFDSLVPFGDMFNTSVNDHERSSFWYFDDDKNFYVEAGRDIIPNEEIFIRYNDGYNSDFLLYYGFTLKKNKNGKIENFVIKDEFGNVICDVRLKLPNPSIRDFKLNLMKKIMKEKIDDIDLLELIKENLNRVNKFYDDHLIYDETDFGNISKINMENIKRIIEEEHMVIRENLIFIDRIIQIMKNKGGGFINDNLSYYDVEFLQNYKFRQGL